MVMFLGGFHIDFNKLPKEHIQMGVDPCHFALELLGNEHLWEQIEYFQRKDCSCTGICFPRRIVEQENRRYCPGMNHFVEDYRGYAVLDAQLPNVEKRHDHLRVSASRLRLPNCSQDGIKGMA